MRRYLDLNLSQTHRYQVGKLRHREAVNLSEAHGKLGRGWEQTPPGPLPTATLPPTHWPRETSQGREIVFTSAWLLGRSASSFLQGLVPGARRLGAELQGLREEGPGRQGVPMPLTGLWPAPAGTLPPSSCSPHLRSRRERFPL